MKKILCALVFLPTLSFANLYTCTGAGFAIDIQSNPMEMKVVGNGINTLIPNLKLNATFDTVLIGNSQNPAATMKITIKDSSFANPGDNFKAIFTVSSSAGVKDYSGLTCLRGND
jgi:hypothetical protein